jgi:hypothetical protein
MWQLDDDPDQEKVGRNMRGRTPGTAPGLCQASPGQPQASRILISENWGRPLVQPQDIPGQSPDDPRTKSGVPRGEPGRSQAILRFRKTALKKLGVMSGKTPGIPGYDFADNLRWHPGYFALRGIFAWFPRCRPSPRGDCLFFWLDQDSRMGRLNPNAR